MLSEEAKRVAAKARDQYDRTLRDLLEKEHHGKYLCIEHFRRIERLGLREYTSTTAILADGKQVDMPTYTCHVDWFGSVYRTQVVANEGSYALLGTMLLADHDLTIRYKRRSLTLDWLNGPRIALRPINPPSARRR